MILSADHSFMRRTNQRSMLEVLFKNKELSRADLARLLNLSKPAVADNILPLILNGVVKEVGEARASENGGRKPVMLRINRNHKYIVAIDLNYNNPLFVLGNLIEEKLDEFSVKVSVNTNYTQRMETLRNAIGLLLSAHNLSQENLCCIAISSPGALLTERNKALVNTQFSEWFKGNLVNDIADLYDNVPIIIKNDANTAAIGEFNHGDYADLDNLLFITCGLGLGAGLILDRRLFEGRKNMAGEIFNFIDPQMIRNDQNLENLVRIDRLLAILKEELYSGRHSFLEKYNHDALDFDHIIEAYQQGDPLVLEVLGKAALQVACAVANICNLLTIDRVVFGGEYVLFKDIFLKAMEEITAKHCLIPPKIVESHLGKYAGVYGLFSIARSNYFDIVSSKHNDWEYV